MLKLKVELDFQEYLVYLTVGQWYHWNESLILFYLFGLIWLIDLSQNRIKNNFSFVLFMVGIHYSWWMVWCLDSQTNFLHGNIPCDYVAASTSTSITFQHCPSLVMFNLGSRVESLMGNDLLKTLNDPKLW